MHFRASTPHGLRVVPFEVEGFAGPGYSMLFLEGPVPHLDTVQLDTAHGSIFQDAEAELGSYRALFDKVTRADDAATWQKSSFSGNGPGNDCVEVAAGDDLIRLRESDDPHTVLAPTARAFGALLRHVKDRRA